MLVGHQWPGPAALSLLAAAADNRATVHSAHESHADELQSVRVQNLAAQEGLAAEAARGLFRDGEDRSRAIAAKNLGKHTSYRTAHQAVRQLRADLETIATEGNAAIRRVLQSGGPAAAQVAAVVAIVIDAQQQGNARAAGRCAEVIGAIHHVLGAEAAGLSAQQFAALHGIELAAAFGSPIVERVHTEVIRVLSSATKTHDSAPGS